MLCMWDRNGFSASLRDQTRGPPSSEGGSDQLLSLTEYNYIQWRRYTVRLNEISAGCPFPRDIIMNMNKHEVYTVKKKTISELLCVLLGNDRPVKKVFFFNLFSNTGIYKGTIKWI